MLQRMPGAAAARSREPRCQADSPAGCTRAQWNHAALPRLTWMRRAGRWRRGPAACASLCAAGCPAAWHTSGPACVKAGGARVSGGAAAQACSAAPLAAGTQALAPSTPHLVGIRVQVAAHGWSDFRVRHPQPAHVRGRLLLQVRVGWPRRAAALAAARRRRLRVRRRERRRGSAEHRCSVSAGKAWRQAAAGPATSAHPQQGEAAPSQPTSTT